MENDFNDITNVIYDEMCGKQRDPLAHYLAVSNTISKMPHEELVKRQQAADLSFLHQGITFTVYGREEGTEKIFPYDLIPRIITGTEWQTIEKGLKQRIAALNHFLHDIYHEENILKEGIVPRELVYTCKHYRREMRGVEIPKGIYISVVGSESGQTF